MLDELHKDIEGYEELYALSQSSKVYFYKSKRYIKSC